ncbi:hypothetical protein Droror1_Dr00007918 [Drosera rotundifolia]
MATWEDTERGDNSAQAELTESLIHVKASDDTNGVEAGRRRQPWMVYLSTIVAVCGSYEYGACLGYSSPTQSAITEDLSLSAAEAMRVYAVFCAAGWLSIYFAEGILALDIGRLTGGYGIGAFSFVVPIYITEIAPMELRGALTTLNLVMLSTGVSVAYIIGIVLSWRALALTGLIPCAILLVGLFFIPESPRWLLKREHRKEFEVALQKLRGKDVGVTRESEEIQNYIEELQQLPKENVFELFQKRYRKSIIIGIGLMVIRQFGGINGVCFYAASIFESAGFSATIGTVAYASIQMVFSVFGAPLIDKAGRKPLLLVSGVGLVLGCALAALSFYFKAHDVATNASPALAVAGLLVYIAAYSVGMGGVPWVVMSEVFPINIKGIAGSLATLVNWFGAWAVTYTFNFLMSWSSYGTFILYAAINALAIVFVVYVVPETKGRSLEEIQATINS